MYWFILRRLVASVITVFLAIVAIFLGVRALPGTPAQAMAGESATPAQLKALTAEYGFDKPLPVQFVRYLWLALHGNLGMSTEYHIPVSTLIVQRIPITLEITILAMAVGLAIGMTAGVISAVRSGSVVDYAANGFGLFGLSVPHFLLGLLGILLFAQTLHLLPASGYVSFTTSPGQNLQRMILPCLVLGTGLSAVIMRQTRSALITQIGADYVRTARSKGVSRGREISHALRNSLTTVTTVVGLQVAGLISGVVIVEQIFVIPGFGNLIISAVTNRDYPVVQGAVIVTVVGYVIVNLLVDVAYAYLNPRIRVSGGVR